MPKQGVARQIGRPFKKGEGGRPPGTKNKFTSLKESFLEAFRLTGGTKGLAEWIRKSERNRALFYQLVTKLFPQEIAGSGPNNEIQLLLRVIHTEAGDKGNGNGNGGEKK